MATRVWRGADGTWYDASQWSTTTANPASYPLPGDTVTIGSGTVDLIGSQAITDGTFDDIDVTLGTSGGPVTTLTLTQAILNTNFDIVTAGSSEIMSVGTSVFDGVLEDYSGLLTLASQANGANPGNLVFGDGSILVLQNQEGLDVEGNVTFTAGSGLSTSSPVLNNGVITQIGTATAVSGYVTGNGIWDIAAFSNLSLLSDVASGQTVVFGSDAGLGIGNLPAFSAAISGFATGDLLDIASVTATAASYDASTDTLTLLSGGTAVASIANFQAASGTLVAASDGGNGTLITYAGAPTRQQAEIAAADVAMRSNIVRSTMTVPGTSTPITGAGVKIGIISNSFDAAKPGTANTDAANGYLPQTATGQSAVTVLKEGATGQDDEGRAMAELIYQAAPGAQLYFAAAGNSQTTMADSIDALVAAGVKIIVDDISFPDTPMYQLAGVLDTAVSNAVAGGVNYFTSAANYGDAYLEQQFTPQAATLYDGTAVDAQLFSNGTPYETISDPDGNNFQINLQWTAPYQGLDNTGAPDALSFKIFDSMGNLVTTSTQTIEGVATTDIVGSIYPDARPYTYQLAVYLNGGQVQPGAFKLLVTGADFTGPGAEILDPAAGNGSGNLRGQELIPDVNTVGAIYYGDSPAYGQTPAATEFFSDSGPGSLYYDSNGVPYATPQSAGKVDFVAPDGVNTTVAAVTPFFGTSAAAPNAAAVAALLLQAEPTLTTAQVSSALSQSAISLGQSSAIQGTGLIQADRAVTLAEDSVTCFCPGTLILTAQGERRVEDLAIGDPIITASGQTKPIRWIGRRSYAGAFIAGQHLKLPIGIKRGALAPNVPHSDLWVSPGHAMMLDGHLVPAWRLINDVSIIQPDAVDSVTYYHVELDTHDVLLANGAAAESFLDDDCRAQFHNAAEFHARYPDARPIPALAPRLEDGFALQFIQDRIADRAGAMLAPEPAGPLHGFIDIATAGHVCGWALDLENPEEPVTLEVRVGAHPVLCVLANRYRADLRKAGVGSGCHAFAIDLPAGLDGDISVRRVTDQAIVAATDASRTRRAA